jgi:hypothetical protein
MRMPRASSRAPEPMPMGLTAAEAQHRLAETGPNALETTDQEGWWRPASRNQADVTGDGTWTALLPQRSVRKDAGQTVVELTHELPGLDHGNVLEELDRPRRDATSA